MVEKRILYYRLDAVVSELLLLPGLLGPKSKTGKKSKEAIAIITTQNHKDIWLTKQIYKAVRNKLIKRLRPNVKNANKKNSPGSVMMNPLA